MSAQTSAVPTGPCMNLLFRFFRRATRRPPRDPSASSAKDNSNDTSPGTNTISDTSSSNINSLNLITRGVTPSSDEGSIPKQQYLEPTILGCSTPEYKLREIVERPDGVDYNEWLASHSKLYHFSMI